MFMLRFSIIIPVYNSESFLEESIKSIQCQLDIDDEIILVDDGSTDQSGKICDCFSSEADHIIVIHKSNGGVANARNLGIKEARGRFLIFIDGDDTIEAGTLEYLSSYCGLSDMTIFGMSFDYYKRNAFIRSEQLSCEECGIVSFDEIRNNFIRLFYNNAFSSACNKVFCADIIREKELFFNEDMNLYEDFDFVLRYLRFCNQVTFVNKPLYHYRLNSDNSHLNSRLRDLASLYYNMECLLFSIKEFSNGNIDINSVGTNLYLQLLYQHMLQYQWDEDSVVKYCNLPIFKKILDIDYLHNNERRLYLRIINTKFRSIRKDIKLKKSRIFIKYMIKCLLNKH